MGRVKTRRSSRDGKARYTACYRDRQGVERSAGTFPNRKDADRAWHRAETLLAEGRLGDPGRGRLTFASYAADVWFPNHVIEPSTRESYGYSIGKHLVPFFGPMRMIDILPSHVREWVHQLHANGVSPITIRYNKIILSAIFSTALNDQVTQLHPCKGVKTPTVARRPYRIVTPEQFDELHRALPDALTRLLVETAVETGLRWGELTELRPRDIEPVTRVVTVSRAVVQVSPKYHPAGRRFHVKDYPKSRLSRRVKLTAHLAALLAQHIADLELGPDDLLFSMPENPPAGGLIVTKRDDLGRTEPNESGGCYRHGTLSAYTAGRCRCADCRDAFARYRADRRSAGKDQPRGVRRRDSDGHIGRNWFRNSVWRPAVATAGIDGALRMHDLRHAHASWLLAGGADLQQVKERLGHASIATTERYLHTLPDADERALDAFEKIRHRSST